MDFELPKLNSEDYLTQGIEFWKNYRITLYKIINEQEQDVQLEKTPENIWMFAKKHGVKASARYFNIQPSMVRYYRKKLEEKNDKIS